MKKVLAVAVAAAACSAFGLPSAVAGSGDTGKACPPPSHNPNGSPPCGNQGNNGHKKKCPPKSKNPGGTQPCGKARHGSVDVVCPPKSKNPGGHPPCGIDHHDGGDDGGGDDGGEPPTPPAGNCTVADVVLLTPDAKIVCLYLGANAPNATSDCPDGLVRAAVDSLAGACVFLPPEDN
jgi:hypothetical protein